MSWEVMRQRSKTGRWPSLAPRSRRRFVKVHAGGSDASLPTRLFRWPNAGVPLHASDDSARRFEDRRTRQTARKISKREKDLRKRTDDAEDDPQALRDFARGRKSCWKTASRSWGFHVRPWPHPEGSPYDRTPGRRGRHRAEASERSHPAQNVGSLLLGL